jgi:hypothetical protein
MYHRIVETVVTFLTWYALWNVMDFLRHVTLGVAAGR